MRTNPETDKPSLETLRMVRRYECKMNGHSWQIIVTYGEGPIAVVCNHCGADSGLARKNTTAASEDT